MSCKQANSYHVDIPSSIDLNKILSDSFESSYNLKCINYTIFDEPCLELINDKSKKVIRLTCKKRQLETTIVTIQSLNDGGAILSKKVLDPESFGLMSIYTIGYKQSFNCIKKIEPRYDFSILIDEISRLCGPEVKQFNDPIDFYSIEYVNNGLYKNCQYVNELSFERMNLVNRILNEIVNRTDFN